METEVALEQRLRGAIYGLLIGDALGVPYEFHDSISLPASNETEYEPPTWFRRSHAGVPPGTWSDDGAQALVLLDSLLECGRFDIQHFARGLLAWHDQGFYSVDGVAFDVGLQTRTAIAEIRDGINPLYSGGIDEWSNGNGSLMRCLPLALWHQGSDEELISLAFQQSAPTHGHLRSKLCCAIYCLWARGIMASKVDAWEWAIETLKANLTSEQAGELDKKVAPSDRSRIIRGSGYVVDCLHAARRCCEKPDYETAVKAAVALGNDTDTTACVAGGIAGLMHGFDKIPSRWVEGLRGKQKVEPLVSALVRRHF